MSLLFSTYTFWNVLNQDIFIFRENNLIIVKDGKMKMKIFWVGLKVAVSGVRTNNFGGVLNSG